MEVAIPDDIAFTRVEAACESVRKDDNLIKRNRLIFRVFDRGLRRWEVANLLCSSIPSAQSLRTRRERAKKTGVLRPVPIQIMGAKKSGVRVVLFPLRLAELLREFIDEVRPLLAPDSSEDAVFTSACRQRGRLQPQSLTNLIQMGRAIAIDEARASGADQEQIDEIRSVHGHLYRHRHITNSLVNGIEAGLEPVHVLLDTMKGVGIKSFQTMSIYSHVAESRRKCVLEKKQKIYAVEDDEVLKRLETLRASELFLKKRFSRS
ncbi:hypothetical protein [Pseudorhizobium halotolerans]|nr:hypothetical protein [Pseudorhizobium halotolerans]